MPTAAAALAEACHGNALAVLGLRVELDGGLWLRAMRPGDSPAQGGIIAA